MELTAKITAKIHAYTFDGVPEDAVVTVFIPGMKVPIKAMLSDVEIEGAAKNAVEELKPVTLYTTFTTFNWAPFPSPGPSVKGVDALKVLKEAIPGLDGITTGCPECAAKGSAWMVQMASSGAVFWASGPLPLVDVIVHLNDHHQWSREAVADWLETKDWDLQFVTPEEKVS